MEKLRITLSRVVKIVCIVLICAFFMPAFTVSCSDKEVDVTPIHGFWGYIEKDPLISEETIVVSAPDGKYALLFLIPLFVLILWLLYSESVKKRIFMNVFTIAGSIVDVIVLILFKNQVYSIADDYYLDVQVRYGFPLSLILSGLLCILGVAHFVLEMKNGVYPALRQKKANAENAGKRKKTASEVFAALLVIVLVLSTVFSIFWTGVGLLVNAGPKTRRTPAEVERYLESLDQNRSDASENKVNESR